ncbi:hypothetical protein EV356DRAFT_240013 [Viridothelium virens]|uniref:Uncharacterized protein n=1 Tax=Viridothelium virens TaxID=1048519 RepID=A0A6A6H4L9_VIRVR|nr:hypothetical protein EV356DRAFT_240013 [Viridothelium virens]
MTVRINPNRIMGTQARARSTSPNVRLKQRNYPRLASCNSFRITRYPPVLASPSVTTHLVDKSPWIADLLKADTHHAGPASAIKEVHEMSTSLNRNESKDAAFSRYPRGEISSLMYNSLCDISANGSLQLSLRKTGRVKAHSCEVQLENGGGW